MSFMSMWNTLNNLGSFLTGGNGNRRQIILSCDGDKFTIPVTPSKYDVTTGQNNRVVDIIDFGEAQLFGNPQVVKLSFSCFFPNPIHDYPFVVGDSLEPSEAVEKIIKWKESKKPVRVIITDSPFNLAMAINKFTWREQDGSRDIYYTLDFVEWKDLNTPLANNEKQVDGKTGLKQRSTANIPPKPSAISRTRDILEASKKAYGNVNKWRNLANANGLKNLALRETRGLIIKKGGIK
ncbi:hypothetical protein [Selenomonas ruminantium]|uniref:hypothetical protein n=1 Tax=Selenomonas ruminantium TaxID=971 RepID=UPI0026EE9C1E|nr:hypothetical protein [Selenomonas ruminantium]